MDMHAVVPTHPAALEDPNSGQVVQPTGWLARFPSISPLGLLRIERGLERGSGGLSVPPSHSWKANYAAFVMGIHGRFYTKIM